MAALERILKTGGVKKISVSPIKQTRDQHSFTATVEFGSPTAVHIPGNELKGFNYLIDHSITGNRHTLSVSGTNQTAIRELYAAMSKHQR